MYKEVERYFENIIYIYICHNFMMAKISQIEFCTFI